ncbi:2-phospho-L-lactate guanylyltransferase [Nocardioides antri]|uniref:2-phospho-L-lactate guanylyltransferase n=1 Tax=Nocardioides antri TaxID=2607659 RepID=A0A5B1M074_9ACTN|nr:2-phospho-L-lactate guanylyltransferase [Nocardioides antri]KAA1426323.1 2-phospho-L-lactate guanylyltransferase [Nocardioides antri]
MGTYRTQHVVVVPVKPPGIGKTRLVGVPAGQRVSLATAFATDTVAACLATPGVARVLVTTDDARFATTLSSLGADCCPDGSHGLNPALVQAVAEARRRWPGLRPVALCADLPALRPEDLAAALTIAAGRTSYVADAAGTGTTLYASSYDDFDPRFGADSAAAHAAAGAAAVPGDLPGLRQDVDDLASLRAAIALGVGPATRAALGALPVAEARDSEGPPSS